MLEAGVCRRIAIVSAIVCALGSAPAAAAAAGSGPGPSLVPATVAPLRQAPAPTSTVAADAQAITRPGPGYWLAGGDGGVFPFGRGAYEGGLATSATNAPVVAEALTHSGLGYWLAAADGGVFAFGDAAWHGSLVGRATLGGPVIGLAATPDGGGYWLATDTGGVYAFGDARYLGGLSGRPLSAPIVSVAATPDGGGYWLAGSDGAVYAFGDAPYLGGVTNQPRQAPITAMSATRTGHGYWLVGQDGGVFAFGDAPYAGSLSGRPHAAIIGIAGDTGSDGYWLAGADGGVFSFGNAGYFGSVGQSQLNRPIVAIASGTGIAIPRAPTSPASALGFDISWPQCGNVHPAPPYGFGVIGVTDGHLFSTNPCLEQQWGWATAYGSFAALYINSDGPTAVEYAGVAATDGLHCGLDAGCILDRWGRDGVDDALRSAGRLPAPMWWIDVETSNVWLPDPAANAVIIRAMVDELQKAGKRVGIYSTPSQWARIAGGYAPDLPLWVPGAPAADPGTYCEGQSFGGGVVWMAQSGRGGFDSDQLCGAGLRAYARAFAAPAPLAVPQDPAPGSAAAPPMAVAAPPPVTAAPHAALPSFAGDLGDSGVLAVGTVRGHGSRRRPHGEALMVVSVVLLACAMERRCVRAR